MADKKGKNSVYVKTACVVFASMLAVSPMVGCGQIQSMLGGGGGGTKGTVNTLSTLSQRSFKLEPNAVNEMCNGALKLTYLDMQRRPMSTFSGEELASAGMSGVDSQGDVSELQTNDIVIQVDVSFTWNVNTYTDVTTQVLGSPASPPQTLGEILVPGALMYIQGEDANGEQYFSGDVIAVQQDEKNPLATTSSWNYNILNQPLPETSVTSEGSFLMRVASTARNLTLYIVTPAGGQDVTDVEEIATRSIDIYELPLT